MLLHFVCSLPWKCPGLREWLSELWDNLLTQFLDCETSWGKCQTQEWLSSGYGILVYYLKEFEETAEAGRSLWLSPPHPSSLKAGDKSSRGKVSSFQGTSRKGRVLITRDRELRAEKSVETGSSFAIYHPESKLLQLVSSSKTYYFFAKKVQKLPALVTSQGLPSLVKALVMCKNLIKCVCFSVMNLSLSSLMFRPSQGPEESLGKLPPSTPHPRDASHLSSSSVPTLTSFSR